MKRIFCVLLVFSISRLSAQSLFPSIHAITNVVSPFTLNKDTTIIYLTDFFIQPEQIDSVTFSKGLKSDWNKKQNTVTVIALTDLKPIGDMKLWSKGFAYSIILKRSAKRKYEFTYDPKGAKVKSVQLAGEMNDWTPARTSFEQDHDVWVAHIDLNPGVYQYQLVVDGKWMLDPANKEKSDNNNGGFNSIFKAGTSSSKPIVHTSKMGKDAFTISTENTKASLSIAAYWQNFKLGKNNLRRMGDELMISVPEDAKKIQRSYIRVYVSDDENIGNDILVPLEYGELINDPTKITRSDKQADEMYFVLVDRFNNGDAGNDQKVKHPEIKDKANYYGGDLEGVRKKINDGYFKSLHVNTLWISPIVQNPEGAFKEFLEPHDWYSGYHGYWPISLTQIDHRFGSDKVFKQMTDDAHKNNINVLIDLVANHVHEDYFLIKQHPEWRTQLDLPDGRKNIRIWDECRLTTWFDTFLPTLDFGKPDVLKLEVDSSAFWIQHYGIDGFRHDATKHIPEAFWRALTLRLKKDNGDKSLYQLGETYGSKELIGSYIGSGMLDGQFDFNLYFDARDAFAKGDVSFDKVAATLQQSIDFYGSHHLMGNISGNHDLPRFASLAGGGLTFSEDARKAGWNRDVKVGSDSAYDKMAMLIAFINAIPGVPVIYYGDEIAMPGAGDPDNRRMMIFDGLTDRQKKLKETVAKIFELRSSTLALIYGETDVYAKGDEMIIKRSYFSQKVLIVFNKSNKAKSIETGFELINFVPKFGHKTDGTKVELPPLSFEILVSKSK